MANFIPLKNYFFYCLDKMIDEHKLGSSFLDIGCGVGDVSVYLADKGWSGKAIDFSEQAVKKAKENLSAYSSVTVEQKSLYDETTKYKTVILWDVIEHIEDDAKALNKISTLIEDDGFLLISTPSNPREWRWDDNFYGHFRRYTVKEMKAKLINAGLEPIVFWDTTYPVFWLMRRMYTKLKSQPKIEEDKIQNTKASATVNAFDIPIISSLISKGSFIWKLIYFFQFRFFRKLLNQGHGMMVLARKK